MLSSSKRLTTTLFRDTMDRGKILHSPIFTAKFLKSSGPSRFSVSVSKKVLKSAVGRNKIRRRSYSVINRIYPRICEGFHAVLLAKKPAITASFVDVSSAIEEIFVKMGLFK